MSAGLNREFVEDYYRNMADNELLRAVTQDARNLTPEAIEVIELELKRRNLHGKASSAVAAQNRQYTLEEIDAYAGLLQNLPCPRCGKTSKKLNGGQMAEAVSVIIFSTLTTYVSIACPQCLDELSDKAQTKTALLGWWGIPWGPIRSVRAFNINRLSRKVHHSVTPNKYLRSFVLAHIGEIEMDRNNSNKLSLIIK